MELNDYLRILRRHWIGVVLLIVLAGSAAAGFSLTQDKVYAANATGFVGTGASDNPALGSVNDQLAKSRATSYVDIAKSRATAQEVITDLGLTADPADLVRNISVEQPLDTVLLKITAEAGSPLAAQQLADAWVRALAAQVQDIEAPTGVLHDGNPRVIPIESAELPTSPVSPNVKRNIALGLILGALLGFAYAIVRNSLDRRLRSAEDIEAKFNVPVVASIPAASVLRRKAGERADVAVDQPMQQGGAAAAEAFRKLRTNLIYMDVDNPPRVLVITSPRPGDGKSTVAANIAAALESSGQRVTLIDADLRRPTVAASFGADDAVGLTQVLSGQIDINDALQPAAGHENLHLLAAGPIPPNPSELLGSRAMRHLIEKLSSEGLVILDAPPLLPVTDAAILTTSADGALVVIAAGKTLDSDLETSLNALESVNGRALGVIVNRATTRGGAGGYGYYNGYEQSPAKPAPRRRR